MTNSKPWHEINTSSYSTDYFRLSDNLFYFKRKQTIEKETVGIDAYSDFWCMGIADLKDSQIGFARLAKVFYKIGKIAIFCPPFSIMEWHIKKCSFKWHGFISNSTLPNYAPKEPIVFPWSGVMPASEADVFNLLKAQKNHIYAGKIENVSAIAIKTKNFIDINFKNNLTISQIALSLKLSHPVMTRYFKNCYGLSPIEYRNKLRIFESQKLMLLSPGRINEKRKEIGFNDPTRFYRQFKKNTQINPKQFSPGKKQS